MKKQQKHLLLLAVLTILAAQTAHADWQQVGAAGFSAGEANYTSLALDSNGTPYIAYRDYAKSSKASVMKFDGNNWVQVGAAGFSAGQVYYTSLALDSSGTPYIAYRDDANSFTTSVMKFDGNNWVQVGATDVMQFDGTDWAAGLSTDQVYYTSLVLDSSGTPYIAYREDGNSLTTSVMKFEGNNWVQVGIPVPTAGQADYTSLVLDSNGTLHVAYRADANSTTASLMKFDGTDWVQVDAAGFSADSARYISLALDSSGTIYVAYGDDANGSKASVMKFASACGLGHDLPANTWLMTAPSCQPTNPPGVSIAAQYGDDLSGTYATNWIGWKWDASAQAYPPEMAAADPLVLGDGNWVYSKTAGRLNLEGTATPMIDCTAYGISGQCFVIDLTIPPAGQNRWNMAGHPSPYAVNWTDVQVAVFDNGTTWTTYSPSAAETAGYVSKTFYRWNGNAYDSYDDSTPGSLGVLQSQKSVWVRSLGSYSGPAPQEIKLLIPAQ